MLAFSSALVLLLGEISARSWYWWANCRAGNFADQLKASEKAAPTVIEGPTSLRGIVQTSPYNDIVYELKPKITATFQDQPLQTNSFGMREREIPLEKAANTKRIVGLGDSVMFGWGVAVEDSYLKRIEKRLNTCAVNGTNYEILNFAVPGYNAAMEAALFEHKVINFEPDLVISHFVANDLSVPLFMEQIDNPLSLKKSFLLEFIRDRLVSFTGKRNPQLINASFKGLGRKSQHRVLKPYWYMLGERGYQRAMKVVAHQTVSKNIPVVLLYGSTTKKMERMLKSVAKKRGFRLLSAKPYVDEYVRFHNIPDTPEARKSALTVSAEDDHPNASGHEAYANALLDELANSNFIPTEMHECVRNRHDFQ